MKRVKLFIFFSIWILGGPAFSQSDSIYRIGLILPFETQSTAEKLDAYSNAHDYYTSTKIRLDEEVNIAFNFYEGVEQALEELEDSFQIELFVYDNWNNDSVTKQILLKEELRSMDIIIGAVSTSSARLVSDFCKQNGIINIQPFTPSKSLGKGNQFHLKLAPTIESHMEALFNSIVDSLPGSNIIIQTPDTKKDADIANYVDSLFKDFNATATQKFSINTLYTKNILPDGKSTSINALLKQDKTNVLFITSFQESFANGTLRLLHGDLDKYQIIAFGMPTWLKGEILRLDYLNDFSTRISDPFYIDSSKILLSSFEKDYTDKFGTEPSRYSYLGYDIMRFTINALRDYGTDFLNNISTQRFSGLGYKFDIVKSFDGDSMLNYLENKHVNVFKINDYRLTKIWQ